MQQDWGNFDTENNTIGLNGVTVAASKDYGFYDPLYTGISLAPLKVNWINSGMSGGGFKTEYKSNYSVPDMAASIAIVAETGSRWAENGELAAKYARIMMKANGLQEISASGIEITNAALESGGAALSKLGIIAGGASIMINGVLYARGDISGTEFWSSTGITAAAITASLIFGPEAGLLVEGSVWGVTAMAKAEQNNSQLRDFTNQWVTGPWLK